MTSRRFGGHDGGYLDVKTLGGGRCTPGIPSTTSTYADERGRPFAELVARIGATEPRTVVDLGCGPGNLTALLARRWPGADVRGVDSSTEMVEAATRDHGDVASFAVGDLRAWTAPEGGVDVLVSNATLQWVPDHLDLLPSLVAQVAPGGWLAFQVPGNFDEPSHTIRAELAAESPYAEHRPDAGIHGSEEPAAYLDALAAAGCAVDVWETTYLHVLQGEDPVFTWVSGTGARPDHPVAARGRRARAVRRGVQAPAAGGVPTEAVRRRAALPPRSSPSRRCPGAAA